MDAKLAEEIAARLRKASSLCESSLRTVMINEALGIVEVYQYSRLTLKVCLIVATTRLSKNSPGKGCRRKKTAAAAAALEMVERQPDFRYLHSRSCLRN